MARKKNLSIVSILLSSVYTNGGSYVLLAVYELGDDFKRWL
jgi:hypothetical protein